MPHARRLPRPVTRLSHGQRAPKSGAGTLAARPAEPRTSRVVAAPYLTASLESRAPRLRQHDVTIEKVAELLATAAPKGLLIVRDELAEWITGMNAYRAGGREFWIEAYGGRPYRVERKEQLNPIIVPRLAVAVYGGTQPGKLARLLRENDGLLARMLRQIAGN